MTKERLSWLRGVVEAADEVTTISRSTRVPEYDIRGDVLELLDAQNVGTFADGLEAAAQWHEEQASLMQAEIGRGVSLGKGSGLWEAARRKEHAEYAAAIRALGQRERRP